MNESKASLNPATVLAGLEITPVEPVEAQMTMDTASVNQSAEAVFSYSHDGVEMQGTFEQARKLCPVIGRMSVENATKALETHNEAELLKQKGRALRLAAEAERNRDVITSDNKAAADKEVSRPGLQSEKVTADRMDDHQININQDQKTIPENSDVQVTQEHEDYRDKARRLSHERLQMSLDEGATGLSKDMSKHDVVTDDPVTVQDHITRPVEQLSTSDASALEEILNQQPEVPLHYPDPVAEKLMQIEALQQRDSDLLQSKLRFTAAASIAPEQLAVSLPPTYETVAVEPTYAESSLVSPKTNGDSSATLEQEAGNNIVTYEPYDTAALPELDTEIRMSGDVGVGEIVSTEGMLDTQTQDDESLEHVLNLIKTETAETVQIPVINDEVIYESPAGSEVVYESAQLKAAVTNFVTQLQTEILTQIPQANTGEGSNITLVPSDQAEQATLATHEQNDLVSPAAVVEVMLELFESLDIEPTEKNVKAFFTYVREHEAAVILAGTEPDATARAELSKRIGTSEFFKDIQRDTSLVAHAVSYVHRLIGTSTLQLCGLTNLRTALAA